MRTSESTATLAAALLAAQAEFKSVDKSHTAKVPTKSGGEYRYTYADLPDVIEMARPILIDHRLLVTQFPDWDGADLLTTRVTETTSGEWQEASMRLFESSTPQAQGSAITYARRYAYCAALGIVADEDDDGAAATHTRRQHTRSASSDVERAFPGAEQFTGTDTEERDGPPVNERMNKRLYALCMSNDLTSKTEASRILGKRISTTRYLPETLTKKVMDTLEEEGTKFKS